MTIPLIRARYLQVHARGYDGMGGNSERLLGRIGVPPELLETPDALLPMARLDDLSRIALRDVGPALSRRAAPGSLAELGPLGVRLGLAPCLGSALHAFVTAIKAEASRSSFFFEARPDALWLGWTHEIGDCDSLRFHTERFTAWVLLSIIRHWAGGQWFPKDLWLRSEPVADDDELRPVDRLRYHAPFSALSIPHELLSQSTDSPPEGTATREDIDLDAMDFADATSRVLEAYLPTGRLTIVTLGEVLGMSTRSLQRRLNEAGTSHSQLLEDVRRRLALSRLRTPGCSITDIAHGLGYSDSAHFTRAFRRWFGICPRDFRRHRDRAQGLR